MSHGPKSIAAGHLSCATIATRVGEIILFVRAGPAAEDVEGAVDVDVLIAAAVVAATALAARSRISLYKSTSFCVTPGANGCFSVEQ